jgi:hypothetical protein
LEKIKDMIYGTELIEIKKEIKEEIAQEFCEGDILIKMIKNINLLEFEGRKYIKLIYNNLIKLQIGEKYILIEKIKENENILKELIIG